MKKVSFLLGVFAIILCGCSKEQSTGLLSINDETGVVSFIATFEGAGRPNTKLSLNTDDGVLSWKEGDKIAVQLTDNTFVPFTFGYSSTNSRYEFTATLGDNKIKDGGYAYYPADIAINGTPGSVRLPNTYDAEYTTVSSTKYAAVKCPMMGTVHLGDEIINLKHLGGILSVSADYVPADAEALVLTTPGKGITGDFVVSSSQVTAGAVVEANNTISITFDAGTFGTDPTEFFIPVPVTTFTDGFTVAFKNGATTPQTLYSKSTDTKTTAITVDRASIKQMAPLTVPKYVYVYNNSGWTGTVCAYIWGYNSSSVEVNNGWNDATFSGSTYTHDGHEYHRFSIPDGIASTGNIIVHTNNNDGHNDFRRTDMNGATVPSFSVSSDVFLTVSTFTPTNYTFYLIDETSGNNGVIRTWGSKSIDALGHEGQYINALGTVSKNSRTYHYFDFPSGSTLNFWFKEGNDWNLQYYSGDKSVAGDCNVVYYYKGNGGGTKWYYDYYFSAVRVTKDE